MNVIHYLIIATTCLSICYLVYLPVFKKGDNFRLMRFYLLASMVLSLCIPFNNAQIQFNVSFTNPVEATSGHTIQLPDKAVHDHANETIEHVHSGTSQVFAKTFDWVQLLKIIYASVAILLMVRMLVQVMILFVHYLKSPIETHGAFTFIYTRAFQKTFSFFGWIFVHPEHSAQAVLEHEKVHARQYHSIDILLVELLTAFMWFNPVIWKLRNEVQLVHEYLADEGALHTGIDKHQYQSLLLNQTAEGRLIRLSSAFHQSLIKKRIIMMTNNHVKKTFQLKVLVLIPVALMLFTAMACVNGQMTEKENVVAAIAPTKMNVLYVGVDNPVKVAVSGYKSSELNVSVSDGTIKGENGDFIVNPRRPGTLTIIVKHEDEVIQESQFRVKVVNDPVPMIAGKKGGTISKQVLLNQDEVKAVIENFDFDLPFKITAFTVSVTLEGVVRHAVSSSNQITDEQKALMAQLAPGQTVYFKDIKAAGPSGSIRAMQAMAFEITNE